MDRSIQRVNFWSRKMHVQEKNRADRVTNCAFPRAVLWSAVSAFFFSLLVLPGTGSEAFPGKVRVRLFSAAGPLASMTIWGPFQSSSINGQLERYPAAQYTVECRGEGIALRHGIAGAVIARRPGLTLASVTPEGMAIGIVGHSLRHLKGTLSIAFVPGGALPPDAAHKRVNHLDTVLLVSRRDYVAGVLASEMPAGAGLEALKAQAVLVNTQLEKMGREARVDDSTQLTAYDSVPLSRPQAYQAFDAVANEFLSYNGKPVQAFFHSTCAGMTSKPSDVFGGGGSFQYLRNVSCSYCKKSPFWREHLCRIPRSSFDTVFGAKDPLVLSWDDAGRPKRMRYEFMGRQTESSGYLFWLRLGQKLGWDKAPGTKFSLRSISQEIEIESRGAGHGVGLCQWGAIEMARQGKSYRQILSYYFPAAKVRHQSAPGGKSPLVR